MVVKSAAEILEAKVTVFDSLPMAGVEIPDGVLAGRGAGANRGGGAPNVGAGGGLLAGRGAGANRGGGAPNVGAGGGLLAAPGLAPAQQMFNIEVALEGPPLRKSEVGPYFFFG